MTPINNLYFSFRNWLARRLPRIYNFCEIRKSVVKFIFAGFVASGTQLVLLAVFYDLFEWPLVLSTSLAFIGSFIVSFSLQKIWTFRDFSQKKTGKQFIFYIINALFTLNVNGFLMHLFVKQWEIWYLISQIAVNVIIGVYNFFIYSRIVFRKNKNEVSS